MDKSLIASAIVGRSHGLDGFLKINSLSGETSHLKKIKDCVLLTQSGKELALKVEETKCIDDQLLMRFVSFSSAESAKTLSGSLLYIKRSDAVKLEECEYYVADLFGLALTLDGEKIGTIESVTEGAQALYLLVKHNDGRKLIIPNMNPFVGKPDFEKGAIPLLMKELVT